MPITVKELRSVRICNVAMFDLLLSLAAMMYLTHKLGKGILLGAALTIPVGILVHAMLGINTHINHTLGISGKPDR